MKHLIKKFQTPDAPIYAGRYGVKNWQKLDEFKDWNPKTDEYMQIGNTKYPITNILNNVDVIADWAPSAELSNLLSANNIGKDEYFDLKQKLGYEPTNADYLLYNTFKALRSNGVLRTPLEASAMVAQSNHYKNNVTKAMNTAAPYVMGALSIPLAVCGGAELGMAAQAAAPAVGEFFEALPGLLTSAETQSAVNNMIGYGLATAATNLAVKTFSNGKYRSVGNLGDQLVFNGDFEDKFGPTFTDMVGDFFTMNAANDFKNLATTAYHYPTFRNTLKGAVEYRGGSWSPLAEWKTAKYAYLHPSIVNSFENISTVPGTTTLPAQTNFSLSTPKSTTSIGWTPLNSALSLTPRINITMPISAMDGGTNVTHYPIYSELPHSEGSYYRYVRGDDVLRNYKTLGKITQFDTRGRLSSPYSVPFFSSEYPTGNSLELGKTWIVSKPGTNMDWLTAKGLSVTPVVNGLANNAPIENFRFFRLEPEGFVELNSDLQLPVGYEGFDPIALFKKLPLSLRKLIWLKSGGDSRVIDWKFKNNKQGILDDIILGLKNKTITPEDLGYTSKVSLVIKDPMGKPITPTPYPGTDEELFNTSRQAMADATIDWWTQEKVLQLRESGWSDADIEKLLNELQEATGIVDFYIKPLSEDYNVVGSHGGRINNGVAEHRVVLNRDRIGSPAHASEVTYHEWGGHGLTLGMDDARLTAYTLVAKQQFPTIHRLMQLNKEIMDNTLVLNEKGQLLSKPIPELVEILRGRGMTDDEIETYITQENKRFKYVNTLQEKYARGKAALLLEKYGNPSESNLNQEQLEEYYTPESVAKYKLAALSLSALLGLGFTMDAASKKNGGVLKKIYV